MSRPLDDTCRTCHGKVRWATVDPSGKKMPLDPYPEADGNVYTVQASPLVVRVARHRDSIPAGVKRWRAHFVTCPTAPRHRKRRPKVQQVELALIEEPA